MKPPMNALLSQAIVELTDEYARRGAGTYGLPTLAEWSNVLRPVGDGIDIRNLPASARLSKCAVGAAVKRGWLRRDGTTLRLSPVGGDRPTDVRGDDVGMAKLRDPLPKLRQVCLSLPEATEKLSHGEPTWFCRKVFCMFSNDHHSDGIVGFWAPASAGVQEAMIEEDPARFFRPPYVGPKGWLGVRLDVDVDWNEVAAIVEDAYRLIAPKKLVALLEVER